MRRFCRRSNLTSLCHGLKCLGTTMTDHAIKSTFGERVREARLEAGLTLAAVASALGVDQRTVAGWQSGRSRPSYERLVELARLLNKPPSFFLEEQAA